MQWLNLNGEGIYLNTKMPYIYNYVDEDTDVTHVNDKEGEHGSHVAGIAAANRYIPDPADWGTDDYGTSFVDTLDGPYAIGMAPDAQLLVMKVFGKAGGAYDSDYMAAIEDAVVLECDSCNLSLGSAAAGFTYDTVYQDALNSLVETDTVAAISAGNSYDWGYYNSYYGMLYSDSIVFNTVGSPGSYINAFTVAAAQNVGTIGSPLVFGDEKVFYTDTGKTPMSWMDLDPEGNGTEFDFVYIDERGFAEEYEAVNAEISLDGKVVLVNRGTSSFAEKANNAIDYNPLAGAVINHSPGSISMDLRNFTGNFPFVGISGEDKAVVIAAATESREFTTDVTYDFDDDGTETTETQNYTVYTGKVTIVYNPDKQITGERENATITDFSSWGVPESLILKPEITAPGGNIWSVNGTANSDNGYTGGTDMYELMSGTSMAAPHIAGLSAVMKQYLEENDLSEYNKELTDNYNLRAITQSLLMSTATPMIVDDLYLPVIQQGAGLVDVNKAINATSVVMIDDAFLTTATGAADDGKVKVELGDDPDRSGTYKYVFTIYNTTNEDQTFELDSDFFTQDLYYEDIFHDTYIRDIDMDVHYDWVPTPSVDGMDAHDVDKDGDTDEDDAQAVLDYLTGARDATGLDLAAGEMDNDGKLTTYDAHLILNWKLDGYATNYVVPANGKAQVFVTASLNDDLDYYPAGAYIEGFTYANCVTSTDEGLSLETSHSIPVLGFYGNWTDSSMFDYTSIVDIYNYGEENCWPSYSGNYSNCFLMKQGTNEFIFTGNPYVPEDEFPSDRLAITSDTTIKRVYYNLIRNAGTTGFAVSKVDEDGSIASVINAVINSNNVYGLYTDTQGTQQNAGIKKYNVGKTPADYGLVEGDLFRAGFYAIPEYTAMLYNSGNNGDGSMNSAYDGLLQEDEDLASIIDEDTIGSGAYIGYDFIVDDTAPKIESVDYDAETGVVTIKASDNEHMSFVGLVSLDGELFYDYQIPEDPEAEVTLDISDILDYIPMYAAVFVGDYAGNETIQLLKVNENEPEYSDPTAPAEVVLSSYELDIYKGNSETISGKIIPITAENTGIVWSSSNESIATVSEGVITGVSAGEADIIATSSADETVKAVCHVTVISIAGELNAVAWDFKIDGNDNESIIKIDISDANNIPEYTTLGDYKGLGTTSVFYGYPAGRSTLLNTLYAGTFDYSSQETEVYKLDSSYNFVDSNTSTSELDPLGTGYLPVVDSALGGSMVFRLSFSSYGKLFDMAYVYGPYLVLGSSDPAVGSAIGYPGYVGLPFSVAFHPNYETEDTYWCAVALKKSGDEPEFYLMDDNGVLWEASTTYLTDPDAEDYFDYTFTELFDTGLDVSWLRQSMFYDSATDTLYFSSTETGVGSTLYCIDVEDEKVLEIGEFGEDVWPVTGLFTKNAVGTASIDEPMDSDDLDEADVFVVNMDRLEANMAEVNAFRDKVLSADADGSTNRVVSAAKPEREVTESEEMVVPFNYIYGGEGEFYDIMWLDETEDSTNGFATIKYDPEVMTFSDAHNLIDHTSVFVDEENGLIKFAYADKDPVPSLYDIEALVFEFQKSCVEGNVTVTTTERNDDLDLDEEVGITLSAHQWGDWDYDKENEEFVHTCTICGTEESEPFPNRIYGQSRYQTAMEIANEYKEIFNPEKFESVVVATGDEFPDALTGSFVSISNRAPMLLTSKKSAAVNNEVLEYISANTVEGATVYLLGGEGAVNADFEAALKNKGFEVTRLAGGDRFGTNLAILNNAEDPGSELLVCSGLDWPDAATSSATGLPILIVGKQLTADQKAYLEAQNFTDIYVVGGSAVVSDSMFDSLKPYADTVTRVAGANRAETAIAVAEEFYPDYLYYLVFAYYKNFPDCISGGMLANALGAPILYGPAYLDVNKEFVEKCGAVGAYALGGKTLVDTDFFLKAYETPLAWVYGYVQ